MTISIFSLIAIFSLIGFIIWMIKYLEKKLPQRDKRIRAEWEAEKKRTNNSYQSVTNIASHFKIEAKELNQIFSKIGWANQSGRWWISTELGKEKGSKTEYDEIKKQKYLKWHKNIKKDFQLINAIKDFKEAKKYTPNEPNKILNRKEKKEKGDKYEAHVAEHYRNNGYTVWEHGKEKGFKDAGIDLFIKKGREYFFIQCKHWDTWKITEETIDTTRNKARKYMEDNPNITKLLKGYDLKLVYVTPKECLTQEAYKYIRENNHIVEHRVIPIEV